MLLPNFVTMEIEVRFDSLKKEYIDNMQHLVATLQGLHFDDLRDPAIRGELALVQSQSSTSFMTLCKFVFEHSINKELPNR